MRINNPSLIDKKEILQHHSKFENGEIVIQFSENTYDDKILQDINELCFQCSEKLTIRFYGHEKTKFDALILNQIKNVKSLCLDYLESVNNIAELSKITELKVLRLGIDKSDDTGILNFQNLKGINELSLFFNKNNLLDISPLVEYAQLSQLHFYGQPKNLNILGNIKSLKEVNLWSIGKNCKLDFLNDLPALEKLSLTLGGRENLLEVTNSNIKKIYLNQVKGFKDLSGIERFTALNELVLTDLAQLISIDFPQHFSNFKELAVFNCKKISTITGIDTLTSLERLTLSGINIDFDKFIENQFPPSLKTFAFYTDKVRRDKEIYDKLKQLGYYESAVECKKYTGT